MTHHAEYIAQSFLLAKKGCGCVAPNPLVGALIVKDNKVLATGYHQKCGEAHAEREAILKLAKKNKGVVKNCAKGCSIYVSLEPCNHQGQTPPCTELIIEAGIKKVYFAVRDPNPQVKAKESVKRLQKAGITVTYNILEAEGRELNKVFFTNIQKKRPHFILKTATSLDGKITDKKGHSKWITGEAARKKVHELRYECTAILTGINTVIKDNPSLTVRLPGKQKKLYRIILDTTGKISPKANVVKNKDRHTIVVVGKNISQARFNKLSQLKNITVVKATLNKKKQIALPGLAKLLYQQFKICSVLIESGGTLNESFIKEKLVDEVYWFIAPKVIGGKTALTAVGGEGFNLNKSPGLKINTIEKFGDDLLLIAKFNS